jgi:hypothetical protein
MGVSTHPFDSTVVISFWQGNSCTGTFRLPVADAARLISTLAYGMSGAIDEVRAGTDVPPGPPLRKWVAFWRRVFRPVPAEIRTPLRLLK